MGGQAPGARTARRSGSEPLGRRTACTPRAPPDGPVRARPTSYGVSDREMPAVTAAERARAANENPRRSWRDRPEREDMWAAGGLLVGAATGTGDRRATIAARPLARDRTRRA